MSSCRLPSIVHCTSDHLLMPSSWSHDLAQSHLVVMKIQFSKQQSTFSYLADKRSGHKRPLIILLCGDPALSEPWVSSVGRRPSQNDQGHLNSIALTGKRSGHKWPLTILLCGDLALLEPWVSSVGRRPSQNDQGHHHLHIPLLTWYLNSRFYKSAVHESEIAVNGNLLTHIFGWTPPK